MGSEYTSAVMFKLRIELFAIFTEFKSRIIELKHAFSMHIMH